MTHQMRSPRKFQGQGKNTEIKTTVRFDIQQVESSKDGEIISARTLEERRIINRGITRAKDIELEFRDCKQFLLNWINRQNLIYGCQMHLWDDDILKSLAKEERNCMIAVPITDWMRAEPHDLQGKEKKWRDVVERWYPKISCQPGMLPSPPGVSYTKAIEDWLNQVKQTTESQSKTGGLDQAKHALTLKGQETFPEFEHLLTRMCDDETKYKKNLPGIILVKGSKQSAKELGLMHHKFFIGKGRPFDHSLEQELSLIVGTYNCSWGARNNLESLMIFRREDYREIIDAYRKEFFGIICSQKLAWGYWPLS
ncbi:MAG: hypothetical protein CL862_00090 [Cyanobium sp. NAT70]|nr:hypothetical protein [Cyanobium sp. NAT70]